MIKITELTEVNRLLGKWAFEEVEYDPHFFDIAQIDNPKVYGYLLVDWETYMAFRWKADAKNGLRLFTPYGDFIVVFALKSRVKSVKEQYSDHVYWNVERYFEYNSSYRFYERLGDKNYGYGSFEGDPSESELIREIEELEEDLECPKPFEQGKDNSGAKHLQAARFAKFPERSAQNFAKKGFWERERLLNKLESKQAFLDRKNHSLDFMLKDYTGTKRYASESEEMEYYGYSTDLLERGRMPKKSLVYGGMLDVTYDDSEESGMGYNKVYREND